MSTSLLSSPTFTGTLTLSGTNLPKIAILITGTYREIEFLLDVFPQITGGIEHDIYVILRHTAGDKARLGNIERDFKLSAPKADNVFMCELPSMDKDEVKERYLIPVGPTDSDRECAIIGMFQGIFTAISMMKASLRHYDYVMKTRTDYLPPMTLPQMIKGYDGKIIVDGCANWPHRYPDRYDILWQGSLNDIFCFAPTDQFLKLWDFADMLQKLWTGIPETTLFRNAMLKFNGDEMQSPRKNERFLKKYFVWDANDTKQSFHVLRSATALAKPDEATYFKGDEVVKYFLDRNKVIGKIERAKLLKGLVPDIVRTGDNFFTYKYIKGDLLSTQSVDTFTHFLEWMKEKVWQPRQVGSGWEQVALDTACLAFYNGKTYNRLNNFLKQTGVCDKTIKINGGTIPPACDMLEDIDWDWICDGIPVLWHGDPQPENVLVTKEGFCLLDWREDFGGIRGYGDVYYDLAKIYHALWVSGEVIRNGGFKVTECDDKIEYTLSFKENLMGFKDVFEKFIQDKGYDLRKVKLLSALIYLNIAPLHQEPYNRFLYYFGRYQLNESLCH